MKLVQERMWTAGLVALALSVARIASGAAPAPQTRGADAPIHAGADRGDAHVCARTSSFVTTACDDGSDSGNDDGGDDGSDDAGGY